jgi:hypothetical protein
MAEIQMAVMTTGLKKPYLIVPVTEITIQFHGLTLLKNGSLIQ